MTTVFIAGSRNIKHLDIKVKERIDKIVASKLDVVVGDADGADTAVQNYLFEQGVHNTTVYCSGSQPRNNVGDWPTHNVDTKLAQGSRAFFTAKDIQMAEAGNYGFMIWDTNSIGTLRNIVELLKRKKKTVVFINKNKEFKTVTDVSHLEALVMHMSNYARSKADLKMRLFQCIEELKREQFQMF